MSERLAISGSSIGVPSWSLVAVCVVLAAVLAAQLNWPQADAAASSAAPGGEPSQAGAGSAAAAAQLTIEPLERYREIVDRPLFHASRRPVPQDAGDTAAVAAAELRQWTLVGVLISPEAKLAIFRDKGAQALRLEPGATVGKWSVVDVRNDGVTLRRGAETHVVPLHKVDGRPWSSSEGESQAATPKSEARADGARTQTRKAPTREERFRKRRSS